MKSRHWNIAHRISARPNDDYHYRFCNCLHKLNAYDSSFKNFVVMLCASDRTTSNKCSLQVYFNSCYLFAKYCILFSNNLHCAFIVTYLLPREQCYLGRVKRIWYLSPMQAAKVQASLRIRAVSPEPPLLAHTSSASRGTFKQKARSLAPLNGWACAVKICHDEMLEDTNSVDASHLFLLSRIKHKVNHSNSCFIVQYLSVTNIW